MRRAGIVDDGVEADELVDHGGDRANRQDAGDDQALVERAHDVVALAEADEEGADDRGEDAGAADGERQHHHLAEQVGVVAEEDGGQNHSGDRGHRIGFEQVGGHAGAVADVVAHVVGDGGRIAGIVFRDTGFNLADHVAADVRTLGEDAAAKTGEDRDQRRAEAERHQGVDDGAVGGRHAQDAGQDVVVARHAQKRAAGHEHAGHGAGAEGHLQALGQRF